MEEVEHVEIERCRRTFDGRRKPGIAEELDMFGAGVDATTVTDNKAMGTRQVEHH